MNERALTAYPIRKAPCGCDVVSLSPDGEDEFTVHAESCTEAPRVAPRAPAPERPKARPVDKKYDIAYRNWVREVLAEELTAQGEQLTASFNTTLEEVHQDNLAFRKQLAQTLRDRDAAIRKAIEVYELEMRFTRRVRRAITAWWITTRDRAAVLIVGRVFDEAAAIRAGLGDEGSSAAATADGEGTSDPAGTSADGDERARPTTLPTPAGIGVVTARHGQEGTEYVGNVAPSTPPEPGT